MSKETQKLQLNFMFTAAGFCPNLTQDSVVKTEIERWWKDDGYPVLYQLGLEGITEDNSPSGSKFSLLSG